MMALTVNLLGPSPWGFRISGGRDFKKAITVSKVNGGSKAEKAALQPGDIILEINGEGTGDMLNVEAQNKIKNSQNQLQLLVERPDPPIPGLTNGITSPDQLIGRFQEAVEVSRDENQNYREYTISSPASISPGPYSPEPPASPDRKSERITPTSTKSLQLRSWSPEEKNPNHRLSRPLSQEFSSPDLRFNSVSSRTPTPPGRYSPHSPVDREMSVSPRRRKNKPAVHSHAFNDLTRAACRHKLQAAIRFPGKLSPSPPKPTPSAAGVAGAQKYQTCEKCGTNIVTQVVRIMDDRFRHPECYTCTECGLNLKMRGHFWVGDEMFCEKHARERYTGPGSNAPRRHTVSPHH
ncbi:PDZ and LIM domain protein 2 [Clupea harengus]|uniref:PDZ and LIM domain protein 2 n=1 Tax=Clupea harengus TaxID=7950 RepID=A0A8M1KQW3_CLUHA|nr:PDZ and LIM domain protein 2 [Clupea harengus]